MDPKRTAAMVSNRAQLAIRILGSNDQKGLDFAIRRVDGGFSA